MKKLMLATAAAATLLGAAAWQPAEAQVRYVRSHHHYHPGHHWGWNNTAALGAGAVLGTAAALATAPLWAATGPWGGPYYAPVSYGYPTYEYVYDYGYAAPVYAPAPVVYHTRVAPRRVVYRTHVTPRRVVYRTHVAPRRVVYRTRVVAPRHSVSRTVIRADRPIRAQSRAIRTIRY